MKKYFVLALFALMLSPVVTLAQEKDKQAISNKKFERLSRRSNTVIIDVRTGEEFAAGHIRGAVNMDVQKKNFVDQVSALDKSKKYLLYCRSGKRSAKALQMLQENNFKKVYHLAGGIEQWKGNVIKE